MIFRKAKVVLPVLRSKWQLTFSDGAFDTLILRIVKNKGEQKQLCSFVITNLGFLSQGLPVICRTDIASELSAAAKALMERRRRRLSQRLCRRRWLFEKWLAKQRTAAGAAQSGV